jgi:hypothetical protein
VGEKVENEELHRKKKPKSILKKVKKRSKITKKSTFTEFAED